MTSDAGRTAREASAGMPYTIRFGRVFGIEIGAHLSWLIIVALVTLSLASYFTERAPDWTSATRWAAALLTALVFFGCVVVHELAHSVVALRFGVAVRAITLFLFGGVAQLEGDARRPAHEFWIAAAGPIASVALGGVFAVVAGVAGVASFPGAVAFWLANINVALALFNLLPAFPLDGGRVLRAVIWWKTGDKRRATRIAAMGGRILAILMILGGLWILFVRGGGFEGFWLAILGWFLLGAAEAGEKQVEVGDALRGLTASDVMRREWPEVRGELPLDRFVNEELLPTGRRSFLVLDDGRVRGLITARDLKSVDRERWPDLRVEDVMRPLEDLRWVTPQTDASRVLELMGREEVNQLPVVSDGRLAGLVSREDIIRMLTNRLDFAA